MMIVGIYSFKNGQKVIEKDYAQELREVQEIIHSIDSEICKTKISKEKTMPGRLLYQPSKLNKSFRSAFVARHWQKYRIPCNCSQKYYTPEYQSRTQSSKSPFREMDFIKNKVGVEVQFGKYAFMVYNVCAKMTIFSNLKAINVGIEIVPIKEFAEQMSTGVSYFEQFVWDLEHRGVADIDIPVLILGVTKSFYSNPT